MIAAGGSAIEQDGAEVLILSGTMLKFAEFKAELEIREWSLPWR